MGSIYCELPHKNKTQVTIGNKNPSFSSGADTETIETNFCFYEMAQKQYYSTLYLDSTLTAG